MFVVLLPHILSELLQNEIFFKNIFVLSMRWKSNSEINYKIFAEISQHKLKNPLKTAKGMAISPSILLCLLKKISKSSL